MATTSPAPCSGSSRYELGCRSGIVLRYVGTSPSVPKPGLSGYAEKKASLDREDQREISNKRWRITAV